MKLKHIGKRVLIHSTAAALSLSLIYGAATGALGGTDSDPSVGIVATAAEEIARSGKGTYKYGGNTYTYEFSTSNKDVETLTLTSVTVRERCVSIPSRIYAGGKYRTVTNLGYKFGKGITAESVYMPNTITEISNDVFSDASIGTLTISDAVKKIGKYFCSSNKISNIKYDGTNLEELGSGAFSNFSRTKVYGLKPNSKGAYLFGDWLIKYTGGNSAVYIHDIGDWKIRKLGPDCFNTDDDEINKALRSIDLYGVTTISDNAFSCNPNLTAVSCTKSVNKVENRWVFEGTKWFENCKKKNLCIVGSVLMYYHTDSDTIDLSGSQFAKIKTVNQSAIYDCGNATTLKLKSTIEKFQDSSFIGKGARAEKIETVYVDGKMKVYDDNDQFLPKAIANSLGQFINSPYVKKFTVDKTKGIFNLMGIQYYGENGKGGVSGLSPSRKFQIAFKLHEYITTNYFYDFGSSYGGLQPFLDGKSGIVCEEYARLYAYLLESAGINAEVVSSCVRDSSGKVIYNGNHAWNIVEIGGKWYHCDVCWDAVDYGVGYENTMYWFMVSDDFMKKEGGAHGMWQLSVNNNSSQFYSTETELPECTSLLGDANGDGKRSKDDTELIQKYLIKDKNAIKTINLTNSDANFSGKIEMSDAVTATQLSSRHSVDPLEGYANHTVKRPN